jgi:hypothetical protein
VAAGERGLAATRNRHGALELSVAVATTAPAPERVTAVTNHVRGRKAAEAPNGGRHEGGRAAFALAPVGAGGSRNTRRAEGFSTRPCLLHKFS